MSHADWTITYLGRAVEGHRRRPDDAGWIIDPMVGGPTQYRTAYFAYAQAVCAARGDGAGDRRASAGRAPRVRTSAMLRQAGHAVADRLAQCRTGQTWTLGDQACFLQSVSRWLRGDESAGEVTA